MKTLLTVLGVVLLAGSTAFANDLFVQAPSPTATTVYRVTYPPTVTYYAPAPTVTYYAPAPTVTYYTPAPTVTYYAPAPMVTYYAPAPTVAYYAPAPTVTYYSPAPVYYGAPVLVHPKVYVYGQPVRNFFRAVTP